MSCFRWLMALARALPAGAWSSWSSAALAAALRRLPAVLLMALVMPHCNGISTRHQHEKWVARYSQTIEHGGMLAATSYLADSCHARVISACRECPDLRFLTAPQHRMVFHRTCITQTPIFTRRLVSTVTSSAALRPPASTYDSSTTPRSQPLQFKAQPRQCPFTTCSAGPAHG